MQIALFTDEVHQDPRVFLPFFQERGIGFAEIRMFLGRRVPAHGEAETRALARQLADRGIAVSAVSPGLFGIAAVSPPLDAAGNSVRAMRAIEYITDVLNANPYEVQPR